MKIDDDEAPAAGKLKGGPKKVSDIKAAKGGKMPAIKGSGEAKGGKGKMGKFAVPKIKANIPHTKVQAHPAAKKAETQFKLPKPGKKKK